MRIRHLARGFAREWKNVTLVVAAGAVVATTGGVLYFLELGDFIYGTKEADDPYPSFGGGECGFDREVQ